MKLGKSCGFLRTEVGTYEYTEKDRIKDLMEESGGNTILQLHKISLYF